MNTPSSLQDKPPLYGTMLRVLTGIAPLQIAKQEGLDFVIFDVEHGFYSYQQLSELLLFAQSIRLHTIVRVPELAKEHISRVLDYGASGVMVPMVGTASEARQVADLAKYPPLGKRGIYGCGPHTDYRKVSDYRHFMEAANSQILTIVQIETEEGVRNIQEIAATPGIDSLLVGPMDLSVSLGCPGDFDNARLDQAIGRVSDACAAAGKLFGLHAPVGLLQRWIHRELHFASSGVDTDILTQGFAQLGTALRQLVELPGIDGSGHTQVDTFAGTETGNSNQAALPA